MRGKKYIFAQYLWVYDNENKCFNRASMVEVEEAKGEEEEERRRREGEGGKRWRCEDTNIEARKGGSTKGRKHGRKHDQTH